MMPILRVQQSQSIVDVERLLADLESATDVEILLNLQLRDWQFGGAASLIQLLSTWSKKNPRSRLVTHIQAKNRANTQLSNLCDTDHGLLALILAPDIVIADKTMSVASEAERFVENRLRNISRNKWPLGPERLLLCADHLNYYLPQFYYGFTGAPLPKLKPEGEFSAVLQSLVSQMVGVHYHAEPFSPEFTSSLGSIVYELFSNTHRWARDEWDRMPIERSVRGVRLETFRGNKDRLLSYVGKNPPLVEYISSLPASPSPEHVLLEVSVFDSGSGLAARWLGTEITNDISLEDERTAVVRCLQKHATSQPKSHHGLGLYLVMEQMNRVDGFIRVRTGRLCLFRDFFKHPLGSIGRKIQDNIGYDLLDWTSGTKAPSRSAHVEGTLFSMLIPLQLRRL
jgi:hypothetical protein